MQHKSMVSFIENVIIPEVTRTRDEGQMEYASCNGKDNVFANFERISELLKMSREKVLVTYLLKHIEGIVSDVNGHTTQREPIEGRIKDSIVYLMLLWAMKQRKGE